ncbi:MAG: MATE family efflux transporter, partial [Candidatus Saccharibacteria bacterium]|nr:MATE family efflux transporter [Pseudorhodobacter sp.]
SVNALAAVVIGGTSFFVVFIFGSGFAQAVMPLVAASMGRTDEAQVRRDARMGMWLSLGFGLVTYPLFWTSGTWLLALGQKPAVAALGQDFLRIAGWGMIPALLVMALKGYLSALGRTQVVLWVTVAAVGVNLVVAWALIFGRLGAPELGIRGAAISSVIVQFATFAALAVYAGWLPELRKYHLFQRFWRPDWPALGQVFRLGWPIGVTGLAESGLFTACSMMMGWIGTVELASHGIAMEVSALTFMVHLGLSNAATVLTGRAEGAGDVQGLRDCARVAIALSFCFALVMVTLMLSFPVAILSLFVDSSKPETAQILAYGTVLLALAALFQLADAMQVMALGLLRGIRDTKVPMIAAAVSYWVIGIPCSYVLGFGFGMGGVGLWLGLVLGLVVAAATLMWRFWHRAPRVPQGVPA